ncbi:glycosyltransferase family 2 protein, partial [Chloroflexota bacterium]
IESQVRWRLHLQPRPMPVRSREYYQSLPYDFPSGPVKCHAPFNHFVLIEMDKLKRIGKCENWGTYNALLVDEDWGLRGLQIGLSNVWIPSVEYVHHRLGGGTRSWEQIVKDQERVHRLFFEKWGFHSEGRVEELDFMKKKYKNTNIVWSMGRRSYDWDYIK